MTNKSRIRVRKRNLDLIFSQAIQKNCLHGYNSERENVKVPRGILLLNRTTRMKAHLPFGA